jgi:hypothetical protein
MLKIKIRILHEWFCQGRLAATLVDRDTDTSGDLWTKEKEWRHSTPMKMHKTRKNEFGRGREETCTQILLSSF